MLLRVMATGFSAATHCSGSRLRCRAKLEAVNENTIAGRQEVVTVRQEIKHSERAVKANAWVIGVGLLAVIVAVAVGLPTIFDLGMKQRETIAKEVHEQLQNSGQPPKNP
jgi:hypothetical protein